MTSMLAKYVSKRVLGESLQNNFGKTDPYFEEVPATRLNGRPSKKMKKRKKALPPGISEHDGKVLTKVKRRAWRLDMSLFNCCGIRFGYSSVIGIVPGFGDALDAFMAMMVYRTCQQVEGGLPADVKAKMLFNILIDFGIGLVPFLGDVADALFRANTRNAVVLEEYLRKKGAKNLKAQGQAPPPIDPSDPLVFDKHGHADAETEPPPAYDNNSATRHETQGLSRQDNLHGPASTAADSTLGGGGGGGWFSFGRSKKKAADIESGETTRPGDVGQVNVPMNRAQDALLTQPPRPEY